jgi:hypothetical protein
MLLLCYAFNSFIRSSRVMARCSPLGEVVVANVAEKENVVETKKNVTEVMPSGGGNVVPMASGDEGHAWS